MKIKTLVLTVMLTLFGQSSYHNANAEYCDTGYFCSDGLSQCYQGFCEKGTLDYMAHAHDTVAIGVLTLTLLYGMCKALTNKKGFFKGLSKIGRHMPNIQTIRHYMGYWGNRGYGRYRDNRECRPCC